MKDPDKKRLDELFSFDRNTGVLLRIKRVSNSHPGEIAGTINSCGYRIVWVDRKAIGVHRIAWIMCFGGIPNGMEIDHIDCDPLNNKLDNLRLANRHQNSVNRRIHKNNTSGYKGVCFEPTISKSNPWRARIVVNKKRHNLGMFPSPEAAHEAYKKAAMKFFGEFAKF